jgi:hypothetical protein
MSFADEHEAEAPLEFVGGAFARCPRARINKREDANSPRSGKPPSDSGVVERLCDFAAGILPLFAAS